MRVRGRRLPLGGRARRSPGQSQHHGQEQRLPSVKCPPRAPRRDWHASPGGGQCPRGEVPGWATPLQRPRTRLRNEARCPPAPGEHSWAPRPTWSYRTPGAGGRARCALPGAKGSRTWAHQATGGVQGTREGSWLRAWGGGQASRVETQRSCLLLENWGVHSAPTVQVRSGYRRWGACWLGISMPIQTCALLCPLGRGAPRPWAVGKSARLSPGLRGRGHCVTSLSLSRPAQLPPPGGTCHCRRLRQLPLLRAERICRPRSLPAGGGGGRDTQGLSGADTAFRPSPWPVTLAGAGLGAPGFCQYYALRPRGWRRGGVSVNLTRSLSVICAHSTRWRAPACLAVCGAAARGR